MSTSIQGSNNELNNPYIDAFAETPAGKNFLSRVQALVKQSESSSAKSKADSSPQNVLMGSLSKPQMSADELFIVLQNLMAKENQQQLGSSFQVAQSNINNSSAKVHDLGQQLQKLNQQSQHHSSFWGWLGAIASDIVAAATVIGSIAADAVTLGAAAPATTAICVLVVANAVLTTTQQIDSATGGHLMNDLGNLLGDATYDIDHLFGGDISHDKAKSIGMIEANVGLAVVELGTAIAAGAIAFVFPPAGAAAAADVEQGIQAIGDCTKAVEGAASAVASGISNVAGAADAVEELGSALEETSNDINELSDSLGNLKKLVRGLKDVGEAAEDVESKVKNVTQDAEDIAKAVSEIKNLDSEANQVISDGDDVVNALNKLKTVAKDGEKIGEAVGDLKNALSNLAKNLTKLVQDAQSAITTIADDSEDAEEGVTVAEESDGAANDVEGNEEESTTETESPKTPQQMQQEIMQDELNDEISESTEKQMEKMQKDIEELEKGLKKGRAAPTMWENIAKGAEGIGKGLQAFAQAGQAVTGGQQAYSTWEVGEINKNISTIKAGITKSNTFANFEVNIQKNLITMLQTIMSSESDFKKSEKETGLIEGRNI